MKKIFRSKKRFAALGVAAALLGGAGAAYATTGGPHVIGVSASYDLFPTAAPVQTFCVADNGDAFATISDSWRGTQTDHSTPARPSLNGTLIVHATTNADLTTGRGVTHGTSKLINGSGAIVYVGPFTQNLQVIDQHLDSVARGAVNYPLYSNGSPTGGSLVGNEEVSINGQTFEITGSFGGPSGGTPDLSAFYNNMHC